MSVYVYVYVYICICMYIYIYMYVYVCIYMYIYVYVCVCVYVCVYMCMYMCVYVYAYICIYVCVHAYIYIFIYIYVYMYMYIFVARKMIILLVILLADTLWLVNKWKNTDSNVTASRAYFGTKINTLFLRQSADYILLYGCTTWTLTKWLEKKLDGNYTRMLRAILNKSWRQHPRSYQLYGHLPPITKTIHVRRTRKAGHCWRSRDELISNVLLQTPTYDRAKAGRPARTYIQQLFEDTGCSPEDLPEAMNDREKWRESVRDIRASGTTWWWWWWYIYIYIYIYNLKALAYKFCRCGLLPRSSGFRSWCKRSTSVCAKRIEMFTKSPDSASAHTRKT